MPQMLLCGIVSPLLCPDVGAEGFVLLLRFESGYIFRGIGLDTCRSRSRNGFELRLMCQLLLRVRGGSSVATLHGVLGVTTLSEGDVRVTTDFARHGFDQVHRLDFCHHVGIGLSQRNRLAI